MEFWDSKAPTRKKYFCCWVGRGQQVSKLLHKQDAVAFGSQLFDLDNDWKSCLGS